jgi:predicted O-methyltransferase YrrM
MMKTADARIWLFRPRYGVAHVAMAAVLIAGFILVWRLAEVGELVAIVRASPLPDVQVATEAAVSKPGANRSNYEFTSDWFSKEVPIWEIVMSPYKGKPGVNYLEIGAYEGRSVIWMLENILTNRTSHVNAVDIFYGDYEARYRRNIERTGAADRVTTIKGPSQVEARKLPLESFDIVYIDGSHAAADVLEDAVLCWRLLKPGGLMVFDDYRWIGSLAAGHSRDAAADFPKPAIDAFARCFATQFETVHNGYQVVLRKRLTHPDHS